MHSMPDKIENLPASKQRRPHPGSHTRFLLAAGAVLVLAFSMRVWNLGEASLWADEAETAKWANTSFEDFLINRALLRGINQVPLHIASLHLFPTGNESLLRFPSVAASLLAIAAFMRLIQRIYADRSLALVAGLVIATNPLHVWLSRSARPYAYLFACAVFASFYFVLLIQGKRSRTVWAGFVVSSLLTYLTHYFALFLPMAQYIVLGVYFKRLRRLLRPWMLAQVAGGSGLLSLWIAQILLGSPGAMGMGWVPEPALVDVPLTVANLLAGYTTESASFLLFGVASAAIGLGLGTWHVLRTHQLVGAFWLVLMLTPPLTVFLFSKLIDPLYVDRYFFTAQIGTLALVLAGWWQIARRPWRYTLAAILIASSFLAVQITILSGTQEREDWRGVAEYIVSHRQPGDGVVLDHPYYQTALDYYLPAGTAPLYFLTEYDNRYDLSDFERVWVIYRNPNENIHCQGLMPEFDPYAPAQNPTSMWLVRRQDQILQRADFNGLSVLLVNVKEQPNS